MHNFKRQSQITALFIIICLGFIIFYAVLFMRVDMERSLPKLQTSDSDTALRGNIITQDGYTIAASKKLYKVMVNTRNIKPEKLELFVNLYCIYADDDPKRVKKLIKSHDGNIILSYKVSSKRAKYIKDLSRKLYQMGVFKSYVNANGYAILRAISVTESGEYRFYPYKSIFEPVIGYVKKYEQGEITKVKGVKGIEKFYHDRLFPVRDASMQGPRDIGGNIILNRDSEHKKRIDGFDVVLSVSLRLQKIVEDILDHEKERLEAKEMLAVIMDSKTGEILSLASSNRFNPENISKKEYKYLNSTLSEYAYEPGSVMKPIILSILLREDKINPYDMINTYNGRYKLGKHFISDDHKFKELSVEDIIVHSSNIGIAQIAQKLSQTEYHQGLKDFGFSAKTGIDLPYEHGGNIPNSRLFKNDVYKGTVAYGYGLQVTFAQVLASYNAFNNSGLLITPHVGKYFILPNGEKKPIEFNKPVQVLPLSVAKRMKRILIKTVLEGTGKRAFVEGIQIGGKTGTAHIAKNGRYVNLYNGSFIGFANDKTHKYTIGVLSVEPKKKYHYYGSQSGAPAFKKIVEAMIMENFLSPDMNTTNPAQINI